MLSDPDANAKARAHSPRGAKQEPLMASSAKPVSEGSGFCWPLCRRQSPVAPVSPSVFLAPCASVHSSCPRPPLPLLVPAAYLTSVAPAAAAAAAAFGAPAEPVTHPTEPRGCGARRDEPGH